MTRFALWLIDRFQWFFRLLKVEYPKFRQILRVKMLTDNRRTYMNLNQNPKKKKESSKAFTASLFIYIVFGLFIGIMIGMIPHLTLAATLAHTMVILMTSLALIADFTSILIDTTDNTILLPRPISSRTIVAARITHIAVYLFSITLSLSLIPMIVGGIKFGLLFLPAYLFTVVQSTLLTIFITNVFYLALINFTSGEKFRDIILYFQIFMAIFFMVGFQLLPRLFRGEYIKSLTLSFKWWTYLIPSTWMGGSMDLLVQGNTEPSRIILFCLTLVVPVLGIILVIKVLAPNFNRRLSRLGLAEKSEKKKTDVFKSKNLGFFLAKIVTRSRTENIGFQFIWKIVSKDRRFKLKAYPTYGYVLMFVVIFLLSPSRKQSMAELLARLPQTDNYLYLIYVCAFVAFAVIPLLVYSDNPGASWIYYALPIKTPGEILLGAIKAVFFKFVFPLYLLVTIGILSIWGFRVTGSIILGFINLLFFTILIALLWNRQFPFSEKYSPKKSSGKTAQSFGSIIFFGLFGVGHYFLLKFPWAIWVLAVIMSGSALILFKKYRHFSWDRLSQN